MNYTVTGKLYSGTPTVQKTEKFAMRTFALELSENVNGQVYTNHVQFQLTNTKCQLLDAFAPGQIVTVHFNLRGTIWNDKVITNLEAWKIELAPMAQAQPAPQYQQPAYLQQPLGQPAQPAYAQQQPQYAPQPQAAPAPAQQWPPVQQQQAPPPQQQVPQQQQWGGQPVAAPVPQQGLPF